MRQSPGKLSLFAGVTLFALFAAGCANSNNEARRSEPEPPQGKASGISNDIPHFDGYSGTPDDAISEYTEAIDKGDPDGFFHAQRAVAWHTKGDYARADKDFRAALDILTEEATRHLDYSWFLATCPDDKYRDGARAIEHAIRYFEVATAWIFEQPGNFREHGDQAIRIAVSNDRLSVGMSTLFMKGWNWESLETFAASFAENGEFERAVKWQQLALDSFVHEGEPIGHLTERDIEQMKSRLELYKQNQPLRIVTRSKR